MNFVKMEISGEIWKGHQISGSIKYGTIIDWMNEEEMTSGLWPTWEHTALVRTLLTDSQKKCFTKTSDI